MKLYMRDLLKQRPQLAKGRGCVDMREFVNELKTSAPDLQIVGYKLDEKGTANVLEWDQYLILNEGANG